MSVFEANLPLTTPDGRRVADVRICFAGAFSPDPLVVISRAEAFKWHEQPVQILEDFSYDYEILLPFQGARLRPGAVRKGALSTDQYERGRIEPGANVGVLEIVLENASGRSVASGLLEVRSRKLEYREHYRRMLDALATRALDLMVHIATPANVWLRPSRDATPASIVRRFFFLKGLLRGGDFFGAMAAISSNPHEMLHRREGLQSITRGIRGSRSGFRSLASGQPRRPVPSTHRLYSCLKSLPSFVPHPQLMATRDTPENRFVKYVLKRFEEFLLEVQRRLSSANPTAYANVISECSELRDQVSNLAAGGVFRDVADDMVSIPAGSPVLQRRSGYREVLRAWTQFNLSSALSWQGMDDMFLAGQKNIATLYEYWVLFQFVDILRNRGVLGSMEDVVFAKDSAGLQVKLKAGKEASLYGFWAAGSRRVGIRFSYNRLFARQPNPPGDPEISYPNPGAWTRNMRPDFTLSAWPVDLDEHSAERAGQMVHLHFDAKYRADKLEDLFGDQEPEPGTTSMTSKVAAVRRDDLLKMHAYRDGIRKSECAFVIYPGTENVRWRVYTELLPGLGAIALVPGRAEGVEFLEQFVTEALNQICEQFA